MALSEHDTRHYHRNDKARPHKLYLSLNVIYVWYKNLLYFIWKLIFILFSFSKFHFLFRISYFIFHFIHFANDNSRTFHLIWDILLNVFNISFKLGLIWFKHFQIWFKPFRIWFISFQIWSKHFRIWCKLFNNVLRLI